MNELDALAALFDTNFIDNVNALSEKIEQRRLETEHLRKTSDAFERSYKPGKSRANAHKSAKNAKLNKKQKRKQTKLSRKRNRSA